MALDFTGPFGETSRKDSIEGSGRHATALSVRIMCSAWRPDGAGAWGEKTMPVIPLAGDKEAVVIERRDTDLDPWLIQAQQTLRHISMALRHFR